MRGGRCGAWAAAFALCARGALAADNPAEAVELGKVEVVGTTPLPGLGVPLDRVPANVQLFSRELQARPSTLPDFLDRRATGALASSGQGNPFQPDLGYRGFSASPLLGLPQGLGVFQDGVRLNEPFGDVVNWDLLPLSAIGSVQVIPGTTPMFGPNALGATIALYTRSGASFPGGALEAYGGSWARRSLMLEQGGSRGPWDYFVTGTWMRDRGWAGHNPSRIGQLFAKVGYQTDTSDVDVSVTAADNTLEGNQALPLSFLDDIRQPYTYPDRNGNRALLVSAKGSRFLARDVLASATAYVRRYRNDNFSSNVNGDPDLFGGSEATNDLAHIDQHGYGFGAQLTRSQPVGGHDNQFLAGLSVDAGDARYTRFLQPASFTASRGTQATGDFVQDVDADTSTRHYGAFLSDTVALAGWSLTLSGREEVARIDIADRSGLSPALAGSHRYSRLNPAAGLTYAVAPSLTAYAGYSEGLRAPTAMELTCADAAAPCKLPNAFLSDPPLRAIVAKTGEAGLRGRWDVQGTWSAALFQTRLADDIQFVSAGAGALNAGFFRNVGRTQRAGLELAAGDHAGGWEWSARYSYVRATFETPFTEHSPNNSSADANGDVAVAAGNRIPGIPAHSLKLTLDYAGGEGLGIGAALRAASAVFARGDENNRDTHGSIPGYGVIDVHAGWRLARGLELFALVDNVLDKRFAGQGLLGLNVFNGPGHSFAPEAAVPEQFRGMGAPRGAWVGLRYRWE